MQKKKNFTVGSYITPYDMSGYQIGIVFNETYLRLDKAERRKVFGNKTTYFRTISTNNSTIYFELLNGKDHATVEGSLVNYTFTALRPVNNTEITVFSWLVADQNGAVDRTFTPYVLDSVTIVKANVVSVDVWNLISHFGDPQYDITGDGDVDLEDFVTLARQVFP